MVEDDVDDLCHGDEVAIDDKTMALDPRFNAFRATLW